MLPRRTRWRGRLGLLFRSVFLQPQLIPVGRHNSVYAGGTSGRLGRRRRCDRIQHGHLSRTRRLRHPAVYGTGAVRASPRADVRDDLRGRLGKARIGDDAGSPSGAGDLAEGLLASERRRVARSPATAPLRLLRGGPSGPGVRGGSRGVPSTVGLSNPPTPTGSLERLRLAVQRVLRRDAHLRPPVLRTLPHSRRDRDRATPRQSGDLCPPRPGRRELHRVPGA